MRIPKLNLVEWLLVPVVIAGVAMMAWNWQRTLLIVVACLIVGGSLSLLSGIPTFLVFLWRERSIAKAGAQAGRMMIGCFRAAGELFSQL